MLKNTKKNGLATKAIHSGQEPDKTTGAIMVPILWIGISSKNIKPEKLTSNNPANTQTPRPR